MEQFDEYGFPVVYPPELLNKMRSQLRISEEEFRLLHQCFDAANNLYATIPLRELYGICCRYLPSLSQDDFLAVTEVISHEKCNHYAIISGTIYHPDSPSGDPMNQELVAEHLYCLNDDHYYDVVTQQKDKPWYIPGCEEFSKYTDAFYMEATPQQQALTRYLQNTQRKLHCPPAEVVEELSLHFRGDHDLQNAISDGQRLGIRFQNQQDFRTFISLLLDLNHHTRCYAHRGHTPAELGLPPLNVDKVLKSVSYDNNYIDPLEKINHMLRAKSHAPSTTSGNPARNVPCPCGSGRKYKNCCGK